MVHRLFLGSIYTILQLRHITGGSVVTMARVEKILSLISHLKTALPSPHSLLFFKGKFKSLIRIVFRIYLFTFLYTLSGYSTFSLLEWTGTQCMENDPACLQHLTATPLDLLHNSFYSPTVFLSEQAYSSPSYFFTSFKSFWPQTRFPTHVQQLLAWDHLLLILQVLAFHLSLN